MIASFQRFHPKSTRRVILYGFALVALPLIAALVYAAFRVDHLAEQSQSAVHQAAQAIHNSQLLGEQIKAMERAARQYVVLKDNNLLNAYRQSHAEFGVTARNLSSMSLGGVYQQRINHLVAVEKELFEHLGEKGYDKSEVLAARFRELANMATGIQADSNRLIEQEVAAMRKTATNAQQFLFWVTVALVPFTLITAGLYTLFISRSIRQIEQAIENLGSSKTSKIVEVSGPRDLQHLGARLEWLRKRLMEVDQEKTRFLRHVSHELKTPLTAMRESAELLRDRVVGPLNSEQTEIIDILRSNTFKLQKLIENLLNFSTTTQASSPRLKTRGADMKVLIEEVIRDHRPTIKAKAVRLVTQLQPLKSRVDEDKIRTVMDNLLSNAVKFTPVGGCIWIDMKKEQGRLVLDVRDNGPGIDARDRKNIFEAFYQGRRQTDSHIKGSGLGLSIAREYVSAHYGTIAVIDTGRGGGAHLRVTLPLTAGNR
ncbi:MAG TPA: HAMP domain-containing histidine kinase [Gammaproteobacteria bacterium]|nr:HAMP domain-containing histidine kinase [Gammaproteobacteria bacterium]